MIQTKNQEKKNRTVEFSSTRELRSKERKRERES